MIDYNNTITIFLLKIYSNISDFINYIVNIINSINKYYIENYLNGEIYQINYINYYNYNNYYNKNLYYLFTNIFELGRYFFGFHKIKYNIYDKYTLHYISNLLYDRHIGYLVIKYYINNTKEEVIISLNEFYNSNIIINDNYVYIKHFINNFISNNVIYDDILHVGIDNIEITDKFLLLKNSFKNDNIKLIEFKSLCEILFNINLKISKNLILTNSNIEEFVFKNNDYLNFKTLYEDIVDKIEKKSN
jgi:hypothetical protein